jgi:uncharacterized protein YndB with AHSA1/START domain
LHEPGTIRLALSSGNNNGGAARARRLSASPHEALEPQRSGTKYTVLAMHRDEEGRKRHEQMGFHEGWGKVLDQLVAHAKKM